jgi:short-subunit dehydrogenase
VDKSVFITGGTSGIGAAMAKLYSSKGYRVAVCGRNQKKFESNFKDTSIDFYQVEVTDLMALKDAIKDFSKNGLDIVIASAGIGYKSKSSIPNYDECRNIFDINVQGVINTFEACTHIFKENGGGKVAAISSIAAFNGLPGAPAYCASKAAVRTYCESMSISLKKYNISVTCICPGFIKTPLTSTNKHPMPFLQDVDTSAQRFVQAIDKNKSLYIFPFLFGSIVNLLGKLPRKMFVFIISRSKMNYTRSYDQ